MEERFDCWGIMMRLKGDSDGGLYPEYGRLPLIFHTRAEARVMSRKIWNNFNDMQKKCRQRPSVVPVHALYYHNSHMAGS